MVDVIENIEGIDPELEVDTLAQFNVRAQREVNGPRRWV